MSIAFKRVMIIGSLAGALSLLLLLGGTGSGSSVEAQPALCDNAQLTQSPVLGFGIGTPADDVIQGLILPNLIVADAGDDRVCGGGGNDVLAGNVGDDRLLGEDGADILVGGLGDDNLEGGNGDDILIGATGAGATTDLDTAFGGPGRDFCVNIDMPFGAGGPFLENYTGPC